MALNERQVCQDRVDHLAPHALIITRTNRKTLRSYMSALFSFNLTSKAYRKQCSALAFLARSRVLRNQQWHFDAKDTARKKRVPAQGGLSSLAHFAYTDCQSWILCFENSFIRSFLPGVKLLLVAHPTHPLSKIAGFFRRGCCFSLAKLPTLFMSESP